MTPQTVLSSPSRTLREERTHTPGAHLPPRRAAAASPETAAAPASTSPTEAGAHTHPEPRGALRAATDPLGRDRSVAPASSPHGPGELAAHTPDTDADTSGPPPSQHQGRGPTNDRLGPLGGGAPAGPNGQRPTSGGGALPDNPFRFVPKSPPPKHAGVH